MAATDNILALTKSSPVPVGPGTRRKAKYFQPSAVRPGFRAKKSAPPAKVAVDIETNPSYFSYQTDRADTFRTLYGGRVQASTGMGKTTALADSVEKNVDQLIRLWRKEDYGDQELRIIANAPNPSTIWVDPFLADLETVGTGKDTKVVPMPKFLDYMDKIGDPGPQNGLGNSPYYSSDFLDVMRRNIGLPTPGKTPPQEVNKLMQFPPSEHEAEVEEEYTGPHYRTAGYLRDFIEPSRLKERVKAVVDALRPELDKFDSIAFTGMSGTLIGPPVAFALDKEVIMVRKKGHGAHSSFEVEGNYGSKRYIIVDDGRSSGGTEEHIIQSIKKTIPKAKYVGFISGLYAEQYVKEKEKRGSVLRPPMSVKCMGDPI